MSDTPFIKFFPSDFLGGTGGLSPTERGVYITILCLIWDHDGPIDLDFARLARRCGMPKAAFEKTIAALIEEGKLFVDGGRIMNERAETSLMDRRNRVENATHAINSRWAAQRQKNKQKQCAEDTAELPENYVADTKPESRIQNIGGGGGARARAHAHEAGPAFRERILGAMGLAADGIIGPSSFVGGQGDMAEAARWLALPGLTEQVVIDEISRLVAAKRDGPPRSFRYFTPAMTRLSGQITAPPLTPDQIAGDTDDRDNPRSARRQDSPGGQRRPDPALANIARIFRVDET